MKLAVISDLHDNVAAWRLVLKTLQHEQIEQLINCGDTCAPAMLKEMAMSFNGQIHTVFGNVADRELEAKVSKELPNVHHYGDRAEIVLEKKFILVVHIPKDIEKIARAGEYQLICHGHTHLKRWEKIGSTWVLNPGTAGGMFQYPSMAIVDLDTLSAKFIDLKL